MRTRITKTIINIYYGGWYKSKTSFYPYRQKTTVYRRKHVHLCYDVLHIGPHIHTYKVNRDFENYYIRYMGLGETDFSNF